MHGSGEALALLRVAKADSAGNWPMELEVTRLPEQADRGAYYELWLTRNSRPVEPCGTFRVHGKTTRVRFSVPYSFEGIDGWVITKQTPRRARRRGPSSSRPRKEATELRGTFETLHEAAALRLDRRRRRLRDADHDGRLPRRRPAC